jgi:hypothetical protein
LRRTAGSPAQLLAKLHRLARALGQFADGPALDRRLERLRALGYLPRVPTRMQIAVGGIDMLRFWITPAAADYYEQKGINLGFHQVLRVLDDPASMVDPTGFFSDTDTIIGHLLQVVHANPAYDLQLLDAHDRGLQELEQQIQQMLAGTHPRAGSIGAVVEEREYHARLLGYVRAYRASRDAEAPLRDNVSKDPRLRELERTFGTLARAMRYFCTLPRTPAAAAWHLLSVRRFPGGPP